MKKRFVLRSQSSVLCHRVASQRGVALILTLSIITLVTLLLIAFAVSMRVENTASKNFNDMIKARELTQGAVDQAVAQIRHATPIRTQSGAPAQFTAYVTSSGAVETNYFDGTTAFLGSIPLYSMANLVGTTNLNAGLWITGGTNGLGEFSAAAQIIAGWTYVPQNPAAAPGLANPIIGRYAFWIDDEASKINVNTAGVGTVPADSPYASSQKELDLKELLPTPFASAANVANGVPPYLRSTYPYTTIEEIKRANPLIAADIFDDNRFSVTAYSDDSYYPNYTADLDVFDRQRLILDPTTLNTVLNIAGPGDGAYARLSDPALMQVCATKGSLAAFADPAKYGVKGLKQIIANIVAYQINPTGTSPPDDGSSPPVYLGLAKTPYINEVQISYVIDNTVSPSTVKRSVSVELFYMYDGTYTPGAEKIVVTNLPTAGGLFSSVVTIVPPGAVYASGTYRVCPEPVEAAVALAAIVNVTPPATPTQFTYERQYLLTDKRLDYAEMIFPQVTLDPSASATLYQDAEANDPAVNDVDGQWAKSTASGTLGSQNAAYNQTADPTLLPKAIPSKVVMRGAPMQSIGELGYIHTPNPWQYLRLQPQLSAEKNAKLIPDWAILDIFAVDPTVVPKPTMGRININSTIKSSGGGGVPLPIGTARLVPLKALLSGVVAAGSLNTVAQNIYNGTYAPTIPVGDRFGSTTAYDTIGEICEVQGMDNGGATEADKEAVIRRIANLITVRSNAFTIWVIANSIKEPTGVGTIGTFDPTDLITGEVRAQAVVERYEQGGQVKFRVRYFRYL